MHQRRALWPELDHCQNFLTTCAADAVKFHKFVENGWIYEFLATLNSKYDQVRVQILGNELLPSPQDVFAYIQNEESHRSAMLHYSL